MNSHQAQQETTTAWNDLSEI